MINLWCVLAGFGFCLALTGTVMAEGAVSRIGEADGLEDREFVSAGMLSGQGFSETMAAVALMPRREVREGWEAAAGMAAEVSAESFIGTEEPVGEDCSCKGIPLYGRVKVVEAFADFKVKIVSSFPDLKVKTVSAFADECGEWQFVESFPDFTVQFVESFPDFTIHFVENFPGL